MKILRAFLLATLFSASALAQSVVFQNTASTSYRLWTNNAQGTASNLMNGLNGYRIALYAAQGAGQPLGSLQIVGQCTNSPLPGFFSCGAAFNLPAPFAAGDVITFQVQALNINAPFINGASPLGTTTLGGGPVLPGALWGTSPGQLTSGFEIRPIPEPSTWTLGALGVLATALFRRRRKA